MENEKFYLDWSWINAMLDNLEKKVQRRSQPYTTLIGVPRGGLIVACLLAHRLNIKDVKTIESVKTIDSNSLIVEDIIDSGKTIANMKFDSRVDVASLIVRHSAKVMPKYHSVKLNNDLWVVFPWENEVSTLRIIE